MNLKPAMKGPPQPAPVKALPPQDLVGWIAHLEAEVLKQYPDGKDLELAQRILQNIREGTKDSKSNRWERPNRQSMERIVGDLPKELTFSEALSERLLIVWADHKFWRIVRADQKHLPTPHTVDGFIHTWLACKYHLNMGISASVWREMVCQPVQRVYLFDLLVMSAPRFFWVHSPDPEKDLPAEWRKELSRENLGALLNKYVQNPVQDWRPSLVKEGYPKAVLEWLRFAVNKLGKDIAYVIQHPERFDARRAPPVPHRVRSLKEVKAIEDMVGFLRRDSQMSDGALAKQSMGRITAAGRRLAHEARLLARYRDCLPVKFHKSRGDKNTPTSSA